LPAKTTYIAGSLHVSSACSQNQSLHAQNVTDNTSFNNNNTNTPHTEPQANRLYIFSEPDVSSPHAPNIPNNINTHSTAPQPIGFPSPVSLSGPAGRPSQFNGNSRSHRVGGSGNGVERPPMQA
jgi:hypothetical protein